MADPDRWRRIESLCEAALCLEGHARETYLVEACGSDHALRTEVEALLAHEGRAGRFLNQPVGALAAQVIGEPLPDLVGGRVGGYDIVGRLGEGGMGVVYRAHDSTLGRDVALKVLPPAFANDRDRLKRFEREARLLATVNHPHIGAIYGLIDTNGLPALVLELIEGETLAAALARGPMPLGRALTLAAQIADALDHAHRHGITHRDLKPSNIMITPGGAKLVDFGVGKSAARAGESPVAGFSTITGEGTIVGTIHYMAPEQLEGREADARSDVFSFGAVLYEMLTGTKAFDAPSQAGIIAAILEGPRPRLRLDGTMSSRIQHVVVKCLEKDPDRRWQSARDLGDELKWMADEAANPLTSAALVASAPRPAHMASAITIVTVAAALVAAALLGWRAWLSGRAAPTPVPVVTRLVLEPPPGVEPLTGFDISSDGTQIVFRGRTAGSGPRFYVRRIDRFETVAIPGQDAGLIPTFSPDGQWMAFRTGPTLRKLSLVGEATPIALTPDIGSTFTLNWQAPDGVLLAGRNQPIRRVPAEGGLPAPITTYRPGQEVDHHSPWLLPGGKQLLFSVHGQRNQFAIEAQNLETGVRKGIQESGFEPAYTETGHLVFARGSALMAVPFDAARLEVTGTPTTQIEHVHTDPRSGFAAYRLSRSGTLVYEPARSPDGRVLVWVDRAGRETLVPLEHRAFDSPRASPDGTHLAFVAGEFGRRDVWTFEIATGKLARLTEQGDNWGPMWTRDGAAMVYGKDAGPVSQAILHRLDGSTPTTLASSVNELWPSALTPGDTLILTEAPPTDDYLVSQIAVRGGTKPTALIDGPDFPNRAVLSPDGHWLAYVSQISGRNEIFIQSYPAAGTRRQVSVDGGTQPIWRRDGKELFFRSGGRMFAVPVDTVRGLSWGKPVLLFDRPLVATFHSYDVAPDGRFLMMKFAPEETAPMRLNVVVNWASEVAARVPARR